MQLTRSLGRLGPRLSSRGPEKIRWSSPLGKASETTLSLTPDQATCYYPGMLHGGVSAFLLDHLFADCCSPAVTARLEVSYHRPVPPDIPIIIRVWPVKVEGRKKYMKGCIRVREDRTGKIVDAIEAEALFIQPKIPTVA
ncbi:HotDog domain-containing protein [Aspergillus flavus]|uniref:HotDog domain-containing protein n=1 Tax=Aspergillus flavus TaxID=5059 RepID=A0A5N6GC52_ASPFL|nr:HotDog domain-containing protein [Aspergillus flavus]